MGLNVIFEDLVKIALFLELRAHNMYLGSDQVNQSPTQSNSHACHQLVHPILPTLTNSNGESIGNGLLKAGVDLWNWENISQ